MSPNAVAEPEALPPSDDKILRLSLDAFEGPLDLLLHLIRKHQLNIFDIPVAFVTEEYLKYLEEAAERDLGVAGEYLVMATTLLQIKSAMLLPKETSEDDEDDEEDPREALIQRLLIYQSFKDAAERINARDRLFRDVFPRPELSDRPLPPRTIDDLEPPNVFDLVGALHALLRAKRTPPVHEVTRHELSIKDSILRIAKYLDMMPRTTFDHLVAIAPHDHLAHRAVITFMGLLEMAKLRLITLFQARLRSDDLIVERAVLALEDVALQLDFSDRHLDASEDEYASHNAEASAIDKVDEVPDKRSKILDKAGDLEKVEGQSNGWTSTPEIPPQDDEALMDERRAAMRGRPRYIPPQSFVQQSDDDDAETFALTKLHAELDHYDLDAVLQQALELSIVRTEDSNLDDERRGAASGGDAPVESAVSVDSSAELDALNASEVTSHPSAASLGALDDAREARTEDLSTE